jgi:dienelactone hydrolase
MEKMNLKECKSMGLLLVTVLTVAVCQTVHVNAEPLTMKDSGSMSFPTTAMMNGKPITGIGKLVLPDNAAGKVPLVILVHGTKGIEYREQTWSEYLTGQGYATFILDYFSPRGSDGRGSNVPRPPEDVWGALKYLSAHPGLDMEKVAVMGFSNGGSVTRSSASFDPKADTNGVMPKAFIMFYGGCHSPINNRIENYNPALLYVAGGKDQLVKAETCLERKSDTSSKDLEVMVIEDAYHMFDSNQSKTITHPKWGTITMRADSAATELARQKVSELLKRVF